MKFVILVLCCLAFAAAKPSPKGRGGDKKPPLKARMVKLCLTLAEEALDNADKRSWDDVFGMLAPVCAEILEDLEDKEGVSGGKSGGDMKRKRFGKGSGDKDGSRGGMSGGDKTMDDDDDDDEKSGKTGPRPSGQPPLRNLLKDWFKDRSMGVDDDTNDDDDDGNSPSGDRSGKGSKGSNGRKSGKGSRPTPSDAPPQQNVVRSWFEARQDNGEQKEFDKVKALLGICEELVKLAEEKEAAGENGRSVEEGIEAMEAICDAAFEQAELDALE